MRIVRKYESGAVGSLCHLVALQGQQYSCELEVYADGYQLKWDRTVAYLHYKLTLFARLVNPYVQPVLYIRQPGDDNESKMTFPDDDPFFSEISNFLDIVEGEHTNEPQILSSFEG